MTKTVALLPCPFCRAEPEDCPQNSERPHPTRKGEWCVYIWCANCNARGPEKREPDEAIAAWNTRSSTRVEQPELVERVARAIDDALPESNNLTLAPSQIRRAAIAAIEATQTDLKPGSYFEAMKAANDEIQQLREEVERLREVLDIARHELRRQHDGVDFERTKRCRGLIEQIDDALSSSSLTNG